MDSFTMYERKIIHADKILEPSCQIIIDPAKQTSVDS